MPRLLGFGPPEPPAPAELAREAFIQGQRALAAGGGDAALQWLDRACRLLPDDPALRLSLAAACVGRDDARAAALFATVAERWDVREAWLGLAGTRRALGDHAGATAALARALGSHAIARGLEPLAEAIASAAGAAGWCGITGDRLLVRLIESAATAELWVDGKPAGCVRSGVGPLPLTRKGKGVPATLTVIARDRHLLGSPVCLTAIRRTQGFVEARDSGLTGWAWQPGDPDADPVLLVRAAAGGDGMRLIARQPLDHPVAPGFTRARSFQVPASALAGMSGLVHVLGADGRDLLGSPLDPGWEQRAAAAGATALAERFPAATRGPPRATPAEPVAIPADLVGSSPPRLRRHRPPVDVVIPVHGAPATSLACLASVLATIPNRPVVIDDASPEPELTAELDALARRRRIRLIRHPAPLGFAASANVGLRACRGRDVVLLNSDTLVAPGWLGQLRAAAYAAADIGTVTPLSNSASILSYPGPPDTNPLPDLGETARLARLARLANGESVIDIPVAIGFCMYIRRDCLDQTGVFRTDRFAQGYGEENDFCLRARHLGWRHVAALGVFVTHAGARSFGPAGRALQARNQAILERLHPGYDQLIADWAAADPLAGPYRRFDLARWRAARPRRAHAVILISHADGGGVERRLLESCRTHRLAARRPVVLRPHRTEDALSAVVVGEEDTGSYPNLRYSLPGEMPALLRLLRAEHPVGIELHHVLGHPPAIHDLIAALNLPVDVHVHDYVWLCPRVILLGAERRYCGEPEATVCDACIADAGSATEEAIPVGVMRARSARLLGAARRVVVPSHDAAARLQRHFPGLAPIVVPHENDEGLSDPLPLAPSRKGRGDRAASSPLPQAGKVGERSSPGEGERLRICIIGAITVPKGYDVLLACARDAAWRNLPLDFVVVGHTIDDQRLLATGRAFVTGRFRPDEATALIGAQDAALALLPSIVPETWCYALSDAWQAGLAVAAFDIGAQAERIRRTGRGFLLPLGLPAPRINNALLAAASQSVHVCRHRPEADARIAESPSLRALRTPNLSESLNARTRPRRRHPAGAPAKPG